MRDLVCLGEHANCHFIWHGLVLTKILWVSKTKPFSASLIEVRHVQVFVMKRMKQGPGEREAVDDLDASKSKRLNAVVWSRGWWQTLRIRARVKFLFAVHDYGPQPNVIRWSSHLKYVMISPLLDTGDLWCKKQGMKLNCSWTHGIFYRFMRRLQV